MCLVGKKAKYLLLIFCLGFVAICQAIGFGDVKVYSYLDEPLLAEIELTGFAGMDPNMLKVSLSDGKDYARANIERSFFLSSLFFDVITYKDKLLIVVRSNKPVQTPYLEFLITLAWPEGNLVKDYTLLVDPSPPNLSLAQRPKALSQIALQEAEAGAVGATTAQQEIDLQTARQQKTAAEANLKNVVRLAPNNFSDTTFDMLQSTEQGGNAALVPGVVPDVAAEYQKQLKSFHEQQQKQAAAKATVGPSTILEEIIDDLQALEAEANTDIKLDSIIAEQQKALGQSGEVDFQHVLPKASASHTPVSVNMQAHTDKHHIAPTTTSAATPSPPAPPKNHMFLASILSLLLIAASIAVVVKKGLHHSFKGRFQEVQDNLTAAAQAAADAATQVASQVATQVSAQVSGSPPQQASTGPVVSLDDLSEDFDTEEDVELESEAEEIELSSATDPNVTQEVAPTAPSNVVISTPSVELNKFEKDLEKMDVEKLAMPATPPIAAITIPEPKPEPTPEIKPETKPEPPHVEPDFLKNNIITPVIGPDLKVEVPSSETKPEVTPEAKPEPQLESPPEAKPEPKPEIKPELGSSLKLMDEGASFTHVADSSSLNNSVEIQKKIDLAKNYLAAGDRDSAKEILRAVVEVASDKQKLEAQMLLSGIV